MTQATILLDLDDTLLGNDINVFLPPYFAGLARRLRAFVDSKELQPAMMASVRIMQANQDPTVTNMAAFMADFTQRIGHPFEAIQPALEAFYDEDYPKLRQYTTFRPAAAPLVGRLFDEGYRVVIATNPLFPATAIEQRLEWAGVRDFPYTLVTTMENSHFSKPNPRYYEEILAKIQSGPETTWMIGDNPTNDIIPARTLGLKTWWITNNAPNSERDQLSPVCDKQGTLAEFRDWIASGGLSGDNS